MKICVIGASGQVGREILERVSPSDQIIALDREEVDIADRNAIERVVLPLQPDLILNVAAYTAVDKAEEEETLAEEINTLGAENVAVVAKELDARHILVSTDYVFGGPSYTEHCSLLTEEDPPDPCNVYGRTKREGELAALGVYPEGTLIARTSSVHGQYGNNFVHTMLRLLEERDELSVVHDQIMSPTWAGWFAETLLQYGTIEETGIVHTCSLGAISWFEFAVAIRELATFPPNISPATLLSVPTTKFPTPAKRPPFSAMSTERLQKILPESAISWEDGLRYHLADLGRLRSDEHISEGA
jgi:dTDP-4-dehydrorhamnose reductase